MKSANDQAEFSFKQTQRGLVFLEYAGKPVKILRGWQAQRFLQRSNKLPAARVQILIASITHDAKLIFEQD